MSVEVQQSAAEINQKWLRAVSTSAALGRLFATIEPAAAAD
jgi:hypothetical protein